MAENKWALPKNPLAAFKLNQLEKKLGKKQDSLTFDVNSYFDDENLSFTVLVEYNGVPI